MTKPMLGSAVMVFAVTVAVYALDVSLERLEVSELHSEAHGLYLQGGKLMSSGHAAQAVDAFERAYILERRNREYQLSYAGALIGAGLYDQAFALLNDVIDAQPNDGRANLQLAHLARAQGNFTDEAAYYHRAIYGVWPAEGASHANEVRLEWIRELCSLGKRKLLLGELLPLEAATQDSAVLKQVAHYFLDAGSPARSAELYRTLLASQPRDASLEKGLGEAETAAGNYANAQAAFARAFQANPADSSIHHEMELAFQLSAIDPTPRRLTSREKSERSTRLLQLVRQSLAACGVALDAENSATAAKPSDFSNEAAEQTLQLAESLWLQRPKECSVPKALPPLMSKLAQF